MELPDYVKECPVCKRKFSPFMTHCPLCHTPVDNDPLSQNTADASPRDHNEDGSSSEHRTRRKQNQSSPPVSQEDVNSGSIPPSEKDRGIDPAPAFRNEESSVSGAQSAENESFASGFFVFIAWFLWLGGLWVSYSFATVEVAGRYSSYTEFSWTTFFTIYSIYGFAGGFCMCASEVCKNIQSIANSLKKMEKNNK